MRLVRAACCAYWCLLSLLLLHPHPWALIGIERLPGPPGGHGIHFVWFSGLAFLTVASRFPVRRRLLAAVLVAYAVVMEAMQAFVPSRTVEIPDAVENILGLAAGTVVWWIVWNGLYPWVRSSTAVLDHPSHKSDDREDQQMGRR